jgi:hypothetical protein
LDLKRTQSCLSVAVLLVGMAASLRAAEVRASGSDPGAVSGATWDSRCSAARRGAEYRDATLDQTLQSERTCSLDSAGRGALVETAELSPVKSSTNRFEESISAQESGGGILPRLSSAQATSFVAEVAAAPPQEAPTGSRVPEPATLALLGVGLITIARASRIKRVPKNLLRMAAARFSSEQLHSASGD